MAKKFINPDWKALRKLSESLQRAWFYVWDKADEAGVYTYDPDYLKLDLSLDEALSLHQLAKLPECEILPGERLLIRNFLAVNYGCLKHDYNPHKPAFRAISKNKLTLNSSLNQASLKHEEEGVKEEEGKDVGEDPVVKGGAGGNYLVPKMLALFKTKITDYPGSIEHDYQPLYAIAKFLCGQAKANGPPEQNEWQVLGAWEMICVQISEDKFYSQKSLSTISRHIQEITQKALHGDKSATKKNGSAISVDRLKQKTAEAIRQRG